MKRLVCFFACIFLLLTVHVIANIPTKIILEAKITDDQGGLVSGQKTVIAERTTSGPNQCNINDGD